MGLGNTDKALGTDACDAAEEVPVAHTRINKNHRGSDLEKGKSQADKIGRGANHKYHPVARLNPLTV